MLNFVRQFIIRTLPIFYAALASILLITHSSLPPDIANSGEPGFSVCRLPCWAGVTPYKTAFQDALKVVTVNLPGWSLDVQSNNAQITFSGARDENQIGGVIYEDRGSVGRLRLDVNLPLWVLIEELGSPYCVRANHLSPRNMGIVVIYWRLGEMSIAGIVILDSSQKWYPSTQIESLLTIPSYEQCLLVDAIPWTGFTRLWKYQTDYVD